MLELLADSEDDLILELVEIPIVLVETLDDFHPSLQVPQFLLNHFC